MKRILILVPLAAVLAGANSACLFWHHKNTNPLAAINSQQPDKVLYDRAMKDLDAGKFTVARLTLQTLINAYPDSEYLARAKMSIADSWYREGGTEGLAQAEAEYKDFITFFPTMKEASEAQLKVAEIHFRQLQKPDRDPTHAERAEQELKLFLTNYPDSPLRPKALQLMRDVDEVLADRQFRIGEFYFLREEYRAAQGRLQDVVDHYPLYSQGDQALELLGRSYVITSSRYAWASDREKNPSLKKLFVENEKRDEAAAKMYLTHLIERYPLSPDVKQAKQQLAALHAPIPTPTQQAIAFNRKEIEGRQELTRMQKMTGMFHGQPLKQLADADKVGVPPMQPQPITEANADLPDLPLGNDETAANNGSGSTPDAAGGVNGQLQLESVPQGGLTPITNTPNATVASNANDPNAIQPTIVSASADSPEARDDTKVLTPDEIDRQEKQRILASEVERNVPYPTSGKKKSIFSKILP